MSQAPSGRHTDGNRALIRTMRVEVSCKLTALVRQRAGLPTLVDAVLKQKACSSKRLLDL